MISIIVGIVFILFTVYAIVPVEWGLEWAAEVVLFLKGGVPVVSFLLGLLFLLVGSMVIRDRLRLKKEAEEIKEESKEE